MNLGVKIFAIIFGMLCIVSAVLQYNDPDPFMWIIIYAISALVSFGFAIDKMPFTIIVMVTIITLVGGISIFPEKFEGFEIGQGDIKNIEEGRESVGLLIMGVVFLCFALHKRFLGKSNI